MRRALIPTLRASLFRQWSLVSSHERGPPMAASMGRTFSIAEYAADIAKLPAGFDDFAIMASLMLRPMTKANTWKPLGSLTKQIAAKLIVLREGNESAAAPTSGMTDAAARFPAIREERRHSGSIAGELNGGGLAGVREAREASAGRLRSAMDASGGNEFRDAARLPQGEAGQGKAAPRHDLPPLFTSRSSTTTSPEADKRVRSSQ